MSRLALALLAVLGLLAAGCASGKKAGWVTGATNGSLTHSITVVGRTATIPDVQAGTRISCRGWPGRGVKVPPPGGGLRADSGMGTVTPTSTSPTSSMEMQLTHLPNGSVTVSCRSS